MRIDPQLRALRGDPASQRAVQKQLEQQRDDWLCGPAAAVRAELALYGEGADLSELDSVQTVVKQPDEARGLIDPVMHQMVGTLTETPLGQIPFRYERSRCFSTLVLMRSGRRPARAGPGRRRRDRVCFPVENSRRPSRRAPCTGRRSMRATW